MLTARKHLPVYDFLAQIGRYPQIWRQRVAWHMITLSNAVLTCTDAVLP
jgi:hypothetical protein